jgi:aryl-alcohol dehydrogenase-like predicted oxidoreductase
MANDLGVPPAHLATAWVYGHVGVTAPIVGVSSLSQLESAIKSFDLTLSSEERVRLSSLFDTEVKEESGGKFPGLRRSFDLIG